MMSGNRQESNPVLSSSIPVFRFRLALRQRQKGDRKCM